MIPCAHCGEDVPDDAASCRHCGSTFETGWSPDVDYYSLELPEDPEDPPGGVVDRAAGSRTVLVGVTVGFILIAVLAGISRIDGGRYVPLALGLAVAVVLGTWTFRGRRS